MGFLDTVRRAKAFLEEQGRVSLAALRLEFDLNDESLDALVCELVEVQQVAAQEDKFLSWVGPAAGLTTSDYAPPSAPAAEAERRQLTVMFCDLVGSTDLSQRLDAEVLRSVVLAFQDAAAAVIKHHEGYIAQYLGDGLLVYFGYPRAHEDDARRAIRAGRGILAALTRLNVGLEEQHGVSLAARVGIHTGSVVVGAVGAGPRSETLALGGTTNICSRLVSLADPGSVVISEMTRHQVPGLFETLDLGTPPLKGVAAPIGVHAVIGATRIRSRLDVDPAHLVPFVGRDAELGALLADWDQSRAGAGHAYLLCGEAGLGKSRLLRVFRERLEGSSHIWVECHCSSYTRGTAFHPVIEVVKQRLGVAAGDASEVKLERLESAVESAGLPAREIVPLIGPLLSLELPERYPPLEYSPELRRRKTIEALATWLFGLSESQPLVMLVEDLHWCDASTLELLGSLLAQLPSQRVLLLLSYRPDFEPLWPEHGHVSELQLRRLDRDQARRIATSVAADRPLSDALLERIVARADGVPLFVEELTKMVLESHAQDPADGGALEIPATLQGSLMARLDRLREGKVIAQLGSALGREFRYELLRAVAPPEILRAGIGQLLDAELIYGRGVPPDATYTFKHALVQDTAYQSLLKSVRREVHAGVARALEEHFPELVDSQPEVMARHCAEGGLSDEAIAHYLRAGERATERSANEEAIVHLRRALELLETCPPSRERDQRELELQLAIASPLSAARGWSDPESERAFERACELALQIGDVPELPRVLTGLAVAYHIAGDLETSGRLANEALGAAEKMGDAFDVLSARYAVACPLYWHGELSQAVAHLERAIELYDAEEHAPRAFSTGIDRGVVSLNYAASSYWLRGEPDRALEAARRAVALAHKVEHPLSLVTAFAWEAWIHQLRREGAETLERAGETIALSEELGFPLFLGLGRTLRGWALVMSRGDEQGVDEIERALVELARSGTGIGAPQLLASLGEARWRVGRHDEALSALELGVARGEQQGQHYFDAELYRLRAEVLLDASDAGDEAAAEAEPLLRRAIAIASAQGAGGLELRAATSLARLWLADGRDEQARALLEPIRARFREGFATHDLREATALLRSVGPSA